jgi:predicted NAD/FAD-binding protein
VVVLFFCGSYAGHGFHEDAVTSALAIAAHILTPVLARKADATRPRAKQPQRGSLDVLEGAIAPPRPT